MHKKNVVCFDTKATLDCWCFAEKCVIFWAGTCSVISLLESWASCLVYFSGLCYTFCNDLKQKHKLHPNLTVFEGKGKESNGVFGIGMALLGSHITGELGLRLLLCPLGSNVLIRTTCCSVGIALPVYSTFKAIESKDQNAQHRCLLYWAAYGSFSLIEVFTDKLISWIPMYYHLKFAFLVWLQLPSTNGAKQLYVNHLRPFLLRHQPRVDQVLGLGYCQVIKLVSSYQTEIQFVRSMVVKITGSADQTLRGTTESDRLRQPSPAEDPSVPSDDEPDQNNNS